MNMVEPGQWPFPVVVNNNELQRIFDVVAVHLLTQQERSYGEFNTASCAYRGVRGLKCAVGALIADEHYDSTTEGLIASNYCIIEAVRASGYGVNLTEKLLGSFLRRLQTVHDLEDVGFWPEELLKVAKEYDLSSTVLEPHLS